MQLLVVNHNCFLHNSDRLQACLLTQSIIEEARASKISTDFIRTTGKFKTVVHVQNMHHYDSVQIRTTWNNHAFDIWTGIKR